MAANEQTQSIERYQDADLERYRDERMERYEEDDRYYGDRLLEEVYRPPALVTLVFVLTMLAIYFMGRSLYDVFPTLAA
ncbi:MAG: hypothetical protein JJ976_15650 [Rhodothermales bacterium]|nr:hypothetical protein [Rhodothermales bacterium]